MKEISFKSRHSVETCAPTASLMEVAQQMRDENVGSLVVTDGGAIAGIVTDRDVVVRAVSDDRDPATTSVSEIMTSDPVTVEADASLAKLLEAMEEAGARRIPTTDDGSLEGIIAVDDLLVRHAYVQRELAEVIGSGFPGR